MGIVVYSLLWVSSNLGYVGLRDKGLGFRAWGVRFVRFWE